MGNKTNIEGQNKYKYNILFVGENRIGTKTSLIKRIIKGKFIQIKEKDKEIIENICYKKDNKKIELNLIDTQGKKENKNLLDSYYKNAHCIVMGYDATNRQSFEEMKNYWYSKCFGYCIKLIYLLGNKIDLKSYIQVKENEGKNFAESNKIKFFPISVKKNINIDNFINDLKSNLLKYNNEIRFKEVLGNPSKNNYKIVFLGDSRIGSKTTLIDRITRNYDPDVRTTGTCSYTSKVIELYNNKNLIMDLWDTVGQEGYRQLIKFFVTHSDCVILGYDITRRESFESIKTFWYKFSMDNSGADLIYLIGNKIDLEYQREVDKNDAEIYAKENNIKYFEISCVTQAGIKEFVDDLVIELSQK